jgi:hypothetical protein
MRQQLLFAEDLTGSFFQSTLSQAQAFQLFAFLHCLGHEPPRLQRIDTVERPLIADTMADD